MSVPAWRRRKAAEDVVSDLGCGEGIGFSREEGREESMEVLGEGPEVLCGQGNQGWLFLSKPHQSTSYVKPPGS